MKNVFFASALIFSVQLLAAPAGNLVLIGTSPIINSAVITPLPEAVTLNIVGGEFERLVANVEERSNSPTGYRILMSSANGSKLVNALRPEATVDYTISYDGGPRVILTPKEIEVKRVPILNSLTTDNSEIRVTINSQPNAVVGTYNDTVSVSISSD